MGGYNALHARYNDFQYTESRTAPQVIFMKWGKVFKSLGSKLYLASDEGPKFANIGRKYGLEVITYQDIEPLLADVRAKYDKERWFKLLGMTEGVICTYSRLFVGSDKSSFTGHIARMRIMARAPVPQLITHMEMPNRKAIESSINKWTIDFQPSDPRKGDRF